MQATARRLSAVSATSTPRRRLIRDVRPNPLHHVHHFGSRADFAIEVGESVDVRAHFTLDFYMRDVHLNRADNQAYLPACAGKQRSQPTDINSLCWMDIYWDMPFSTSPEQLLARTLTDRDLWSRHRSFELGPVTDSFSLLTFARPTDIVLLCVRNNRFCDDQTDLNMWRIVEGLADEPVHWLTVTLPRSEYFHILSESMSAINQLTPQ